MTKEEREREYLRVEEINMSSGVNRPPLTKREIKAIVRKRMLKRYAAAMLFCALLTFVQLLSLYVAFTWSALICMLGGLAVLGAYVAGLADMRRNGMFGDVFTVVRRWVLPVFIAMLLITAYL